METDCVPDTGNHLKWLNELLTGGWEARSFPSGRIFYVNHLKEDSEWVPPRENVKGISNNSDLPYGHEEARTQNGKTYYISHEEKCTYSELPGDEDEAREPSPREVKLQRHEEMGFGFVAGSEKPVVVRFVNEGGPSSDKLISGDRILKINDQDVENAAKEVVIQLVRSAKETISMTVCQPYFDNGGRRSALLTAAKKARLKKTSRVRFADSVTVNGTSVITPSSDDSDIPLMPNVLKVFLENGQTKSFKCEPTTTVQDVVNSLEEKLDFSCKEHFSLVLRNSHRSSSGKMTFLHPSDILSEIADAPDGSRFKCWFRMTFVPRDTFALWKKDKTAFQYFYEQCCSDVLRERYGPELKRPLILQLAAVHIQEYCTKPSFMSGKPTLKQLEKDVGLECFLPASVLTTMKVKDVKKMLTHHMKSHQSMLLPAQKQLEPYQLQMQYLKLLSEVRSFGGKAFLVTYVEKNSEVVVIIGPKQGLSLVPNVKNNDLIQLADFDELEDISILADSCNSLKRVQIKLKTADPKVMTFTLMKDEVKDMLILLEGYHKIFVSETISLFKTDLPSLLEAADAIPDYADVHTVTPSPWSYVPDASQPAEEGYHEGDQEGGASSRRGLKTVDLSQGPPAYNSTQEELLQRERHEQLKLLEHQNSIERLSKKPVVESPGHSSLGGHSVQSSLGGQSVEVYRVEDNLVGLQFEEEEEDDEDDQASGYAASWTTSEEPRVTRKTADAVLKTTTDNNDTDSELSSVTDLGSSRNAAGQTDDQEIRQKQAMQVEMRPSGSRGGRPGSFGMHSPDDDTASSEDSGQTMETNGASGADVHPSYNPKLFCDGGLYLDPEIIDLRLLSPVDDPRRGPTLTPSASNTSVPGSATNPPSHFHDTSTGSDSSSLMEGKLPEDIRDLPPSLMKHLDELIARDGELSNQLAAIDALMLGEAGVDDTEKESGIESDSDSEKNSYVNDGSGSDNGVVRRRKKLAYSELVNELSKRQSYQHINFDANDIEAFIASVSVPPPPQDTDESLREDDRAKYKPVPPPKPAAILNKKPSLSTSSSVEPTAHPTRTPMLDPVEILGKEEWEKVSGMLSQMTFSLEEEFAQYVIPPPPEISPEEINLEIPVVLPPSPDLDKSFPMDSAYNSTNTSSAAAASENNKQSDDVFKAESTSGPKTRAAVTQSGNQRKIDNTVRDRLNDMLSNPPATLKNFASQSKETPVKTTQSVSNKPEILRKPVYTPPPQQSIPVYPPAPQRSISADGYATIDSSPSRIFQRNSAVRRANAAHAKPIQRRPVSLASSLTSTPVDPAEHTVDFEGSTFGTLPRPGKKKQPPPPPPRRCSSVQLSAEMPELGQSYTEEYDDINKFSTFGPSSHRYIPGTSAPLSSRNKLVPGRSSESSIFTMFRDIPLSTPPSAAYPHSNRTASDSAKVAPGGSPHWSPSLGRGRSTHVSPHIQAKQEALQTALSRRSSSDSSNSVEVVAIQTGGSLQRQRSQSPQVRVRRAGSASGSPSIVKRSSSPSVVQVASSKAYSTPPGSPFRTFRGDRTSSVSSRSSLESESGSLEEASFTKAKSEPVRRAALITQRPWPPPNRSVGQNSDEVFTHKTSSPRSESVQQKTYGRSVSQSDVFFPQKSSGISQTLPRAVTHQSQSSSSRNVVINQNRHSIGPALRTFSMEEETQPRLVTVNGSLRSGQRILTPDTVKQKLYRGVDACDEACSDISLLVQYLHKYSESLMQSPVNSLNYMNFQVARDALLTTSRSFVTDSKMLVSSATQSQSQVIERVGLAMQTFANVIELSTKTLATLSEENQSHRLTTDVSNMADAFTTTVGAAWLAAGKTLKDQSMKELMKFATNLAGKLGVLMKTVKELHNSKQVVNGYHDNMIDTTHL